MFFIAIYCIYKCKQQRRWTEKKNTRPLKLVVIVQRNISEEARIINKQKPFSKSMQQQRDDIWKLHTDNQVLLKRIEDKRYFRKVGEEFIR